MDLLTTYLQYIMRSRSFVDMSVRLMSRCRQRVHSTSRGGCHRPDSNLLVDVGDPSGGTSSFFPTLQTLTGCNRWTVLEAKQGHKVAFFK